MKTYYKNKTVSDLGIVVIDVTKMSYNESEGIEKHISNFEERWERMVTTASGNLKEIHHNFGKALRLIGNDDVAKKEFLLATFPTSILKYSQLVQNLRTKEDHTYGDLVANLKQYVPQLVWKKKENSRQGNGTKADETITVSRTGQLIDRFGKPLDMSKTCGYCQNVKKWRGIGYLELDCKTK